MNIPDRDSLTETEVRNMRGPLLDKICGEWSPCKFRKSDLDGVLPDEDYVWLSPEGDFLSLHRPPSFSSKDAYMCLLLDCFVNPIFVESGDQCTCYSHDPDDSGVVYVAHAKTRSLAISRLAGLLWYHNVAPEES